MFHSKKPKVKLKLAELIEDLAEAKMQAAKVKELIQERAAEMKPASKLSRFLYKFSQTKLRVHKRRN